ncbi:MAG: Ig-like domain-containing protein [Candidatus Margulisiibacteriota bacterium]
MRKVIAVIIGLCLIGSLGVLITGCGQSTPTINTSNSQPNGLKIKGVVRGYTISGSVGDPVANAVVALSGDSVNKTVVTNAVGEYLIEGIPDGVYNLITTAEGYSRDRNNGVTIKPTSGVPADNTITVSDILLNSNPIVTAYLPLPNTIIASDQAFTVTFNEPMDTSTVTFTLAPSGVRTFVATSGAVPINVAWNATNSIATITPVSNLIVNNTYTLTASPSAKDLSGFTIGTSADQALALSQLYRVSTGGVPAGAGDISFSIGGTTLEAATFANVFGAGALNIYWNPASGVVTGYRIYVANSATGNYTLLTTSTVNYATPSMNSVLTALYGTTNIDPISTGANYPLINTPLYLKIIAYNGDGESGAVASGALQYKKGPAVIEGHGWNNANFTTAHANANNYVLGDSTNRLASTNEAYIGFDTPLVSSTVTAANFTIAGGSVTAATLLTNHTADLDPAAYWTGANLRSIVKITADVTVYGNTIEAGTAVKDLAGNSVRSGSTSTIVTN